MAVHALIIGTLHKDPATRTSSNGNPFCTATVRFQQKNRDGESETLFCSIVAFSDEARATLGRLQAGDAVSCGGSLTLGTWEKDGKHHPSLSMVADSAASARLAPRERKRASPRPPPARHADDGFNDPLAF